MAGNHGELTRNLETPGLSANALLYGSDPFERIVAVQPLGQRGDSGPATARVYVRDENDRVTSSDFTFAPFLFLADGSIGSGGDVATIESLGGPGHFRHLAHFESWDAYWRTVRKLDQRGAEQPKIYRPGGPVEQYLMASGKTSFQGMAFDDLYRMQVDIEVLATEGFPSASRASDEIIIISMSDNRGWRHALDGRSMSEAEILEALVNTIQARDPDVLEGHNFYRFDLPYIRSRCKRHGVRFAIGRDGTEPRSFTTSMRFAERVMDFTGVEVAGRHIIDTFLLLLAYDVAKRDLPGYGLKVAAQYFGVAPPDRTYVDGADIARVWREDPERLIDYAIDDVVETEQLAALLSGSSFYLAQMVPMGYQRIARSGSGGKIESLLVRAYLHERQALPRPDEGTTVTGGYTEVSYVGVAAPVVYADVESLYPSIMLNYDIHPASDTLGVFSQLLGMLTQLRIEAKAEMKRAVGSLRRELDARQASFKVLINSFYGHLGFAPALFSDFAAAERVTRTGQQLLKKIIRLIEDRGGAIVEVDTDGVFFMPPQACRTASDEARFIEELNADMPDGITISLEGRYAKMLSYKVKNYALLSYDGVMKFKGSSLVSRSTERFGRRFVRQGIKLLLAGDVDGLHRLYLDTRERIVRHAWDDARCFSRTETLKDTMKRYQSDVAAGRRSRAASYELAHRRAMTEGVRIRKGDRIRYYVTGASPGVAAFENARLASEWRADTPDENTAFYLRRLDEFARKFEPFFRPADFRLIFSPEDMFGFSADDIVIQSGPVRRESTG